jgi:hypothetical protein
MTAPAPGDGGGGQAVPQARTASPGQAATPDGTAWPVPAEERLRELLPRQVRPAALAWTWACLAVIAGVLAWLAVVIGGRL